MHVQAESILQLVQARSAAAADSALAGLVGGVGEAVSATRQHALELLAELEARLDFDEDLPPLDVEVLKATVCSLQQDIEDALRTAREGSLLRNGLQVGPVACVERTALYVNSADRQAMLLIQISRFDGEA